MNFTGKNLKTIGTNLSMEMLDDVLHFHNKGNVCADLQFRNRIIPHNLSLDELRVLERSDYEINPFHDEEIFCDAEREISIRRARSAQFFGKEWISFSKIKTLLKNSFAAARDGSRPYPSGGALYPVEVICLVFSERIKGSPPSGFYHYRPTSNVLQPIKLMASDEMRKTVYSMELKDVNTPHFAFLYVGVVGKMLVKYRYRGYRYALMETGGMYQQADLIAQALNLKNKLYSGFNDHEIIKLIGIDRMNFIPFVLQSFGVPPCE
jgi:SagB-type dehydrogenase family enzyme